MSDDLKPAPRKNGSAPALLALVAALGVSVVSTNAHACLYYKNTVEATRIWGLPEENTSSVQAVLPADSKVCVDEQLPGADGGTWARVSFYISGDVRYRARGWVNVRHFAKTTPAETTTKAAPKPPASVLATPPAKVPPLKAGAKPSSPPLSGSPALPAPLRPAPEKAPEDNKTKIDPTNSPTSGSLDDDDAMVKTLQDQRRELDQLRDQNAMLKKRLGRQKQAKQKQAKPATKWKKVARLTTLPPAAPAFLTQAWKLDTTASKLSVESVLDGSLVETHRFTKLSGNISQSGEATISVALDAIDTGDKMRNIRLSHLLFQSDKFPVATISASLDKQKLTALRKNGQQVFDLTVKLDLHGSQKEIMTKVKLYRLKDGGLRVASLAPVMISAADFALGKGITKLISIAGGKSIIPVIPVRFNFIFNAKS